MFEVFANEITRSTYQAGTSASARHSITTASTCSGVIASMQVQRAGSPQWPQAGRPWG